MFDGPRKPRQAFGSLFVAVSRQWHKAVSDALAREGFTDGSWMALVRLDEEGENLTQAALSQVLGIDRSNLVRILDQLEGRGLVERRSDPNDRRAHRLFLTPEGKRQAAIIRTHIDAAEDALLGEVSDPELANMVSTLRGLSTVLRA